MGSQTTGSVWSKLTSALEAEGDHIPRERILSILNREIKESEDETVKEACLSIEQPVQDDSDIINKNGKVLWSVKEVAVSVPDDDSEDTGAEDGDKPKKKKSKREALLAKKSRNDPNAPALNRVPLPELRDAEKLDRIHASRESAKRLKLGPDSLPSICFYTLLNGHHHHNSAAICAELSEDSSLLAAGFSDSMIRVWSLTPNKLKKMKPAADLEMIDKESDDVLYRMMDDKNTSEVQILKGHNGPVYSLSFSPDRTLLLSCSEDSTIRLWSLQTWTNICCYRGHCFPVWDVKFSPHGYYFATASHDRTARLWATDQHQPLRMFVGHFSDVDCIQIHPNSNYVATGSSDLSVRVWDVVNGQCVRYLKGHRGKPNVIIFSNDGRFMLSAGADKVVIVWDLASASMAAKLFAHHDALYTMAFSRDGTVLATGGADDAINIWDFKKLIHELDLEDMNSRVPLVRFVSLILLLLLRLLFLNNKSGFRVFA